MRAHGCPATLASNRAQVSGDGGVVPEREWPCGKSHSSCESLLVSAGMVPEMEFLCSQSSFSCESLPVPG